MEVSSDKTSETDEPKAPAGGDRIWEKDRPLRLRRRVAIILASVAVTAAAWVLALFPRVIERVYTDVIGQLIGRALGRAASLVPFSVAEALMAVLVLWIVGAIALAAYQVARGRRRLKNAAVCGLLRFGAVVGGIVIFFYFAWGFNYARADLVQRMGWRAFAEKALAKPDAARLAGLCEELVAAGNGEYERAFGCEDIGRPSAPPLPMEKLDTVLNDAYARVAERLDLDPSFAIPRARAKPVLLSRIMSRLLIMGFYSPWTGEANYNTEVPACRLPEVIAHEKAHQRGVTSEDEANFFGFLACISSGDPYVRYSGYLMAQRLLLPELAEIDLTRAKDIIAKRFKGVQRDADAVRAFIMANIGVVSTAGRAVNNAYLTANRVKGGVRSYQLSAQLILVFAEINGGSCVLSDALPQATPADRGKG